MSNDKDNKNVGASNKDKASNEGKNKNVGGAKGDGTPNVQLKDKDKQTKAEMKMEQNENGLYVPRTEMQVKEQHFVKKISSDEFAVVKGNGEVVRVYVKEKGCEDPKAAAESYAAKLSTQFK